MAAPVRRAWGLTVLLVVSASCSAATLEELCADPADSAFSSRCRAASLGLVVDERAAVVGLGLPKSMRVDYVGKIKGRSYHPDAVRNCEATSGGRDQALFDCMARS